MQGNALFSRSIGVLVIVFEPLDQSWWIERPSLKERIATYELPSLPLCDMDTFLRNI